MELERVLLLKNNQLSKLNKIMKKPLSLLCCVALAVFGWIVGMQNSPPVPFPTQTVNAQIPLDLRLGQVRTIRDTVYIPNDTVYVPSKPIVVTKIRKVSVPHRVIERDTLYVPALILITQTDRTHTVAKQSESVVDSELAKNDSLQTE